MTDAPNPAGTPAQPASPAQPGAPSQPGVPADYHEQVKVWTGYTYYLLEVDGLLRAGDSLCKAHLAAGTYATVSAIILAAHAALQGVDKQLVDGIATMKSGKAPEYEFDPAPIPDWSNDITSADAFAGAWETIRGVLETMISRTTPSSVMGVAIAGLISSGDAIIRPLQAAFS